MAVRRQLQLVAPLLIGALASAMSGCGSPRDREARHLERGQRYLAANNLEKARVEFRNALQIAPGDATARYENGLIEERLQNFAQAAIFYKGAIDVGPDYIPARVALAKLTLLAGSAQPALEIIRPSLDRHPQDARLLTVRAACENALQDPAAALRDAQQAVRLEPRNVEAVGVLAGVYNGRGETEKARALLEATLREVPDSVDLRLLLAAAYEQLHLEPQVEALLIEVTKLRPREAAQRIRLAQYYARTQRPDAAEAALRAGVSAIPDDPRLKGALIDFLASSRGRAVAQQALDALIAANPDDVNLRFEAARYHEQGKEYPRAEADYRAIIARSKLAGPGLSARDRLAALELTLNDFAGARTLVDEVLAAAPRDDDALVMRGNLALQGNKDPKSAIADLRTVLRDQPNAVGVMRSLARAHFANGEPDLAEEVLRRAIEANPKDSGARLDLAQLVAETAGAAQAKPLIDELARQDPTNAQVLDSQFKLAMATGDLATAKAAADALVAQQPQSGLNYLYEGAVEEANHRLEAAVKLYSKALELQPGAPEALRRLSGVLVQLKRMPEALRRLDAASQRDPHSTAPALIKGDLYMGMQQPQDAALVYRSIVDRDPKSTVAYQRLAAAQLSFHDEAAAISTLQEGIARSAEPEPLQLSLATLYTSSGRPEQAVRIYEAVLERNPHADVAANNLAMLLVARQPDPASLERAGQLAARFAQSTNPDFLDTYGWVLYKRGDAAAAVVALRGVIAKVPESPLGLYHLGMAQVLAGQIDAARDNLSHALRSGKPFQGMDDAKAELERLDGPAGANDGVPKS